LTPAGPSPTSRPCSAPRSPGAASAVGSRRPRAGPPAAVASHDHPAMTTLLVLGSKPDPALPPRSDVDAVACANASGRSAADLGLPSPVLTAMSAVLTSGQPSGRHSLRALRGLRT